MKFLIPDSEHSRYVYVWGFGTEELLLHVASRRGDADVAQLLLDAEFRDILHSAPITCGVERWTRGSCSGNPYGSLSSQDVTSGIRHIYSWGGGRRPQELISSRPPAIQTLRNFSARA